ncbi:hypothetical protein, partial [Oryzifoliimicrobium ureilyticus]|uniref:hypothetical protein n=1 Tax=Oryzifoliimicrobium ureilyticus TaxID=3113724 RepID=UPI0030766724
CGSRDALRDKIDYLRGNPTGAKSSGTTSQALVDEEDISSIFGVTMPDLHFLQFPMLKLASTLSNALSAVMTVTGMGACLSRQISRSDLAQSKRVS